MTTGIIILTLDMITKIQVKYLIVKGWLQRILFLQAFILLKWIGLEALQSEFLAVLKLQVKCVIPVVDAVYYNFLANPSMKPIFLSLVHKISYFVVMIYNFLETLLG